MMKLRISVLLLTAVTVAPASRAQVNTDLFPRFGFTAAGYAGDFGTQLRLDPHVEGVEGTTLDLEKNLGLDTSETLKRAAIEWRPFQKHEFGLGFFSTQRRGERTIDKQIVYEDTTFPVQADIHSKFDIDFWDLSYTYWVRQASNDGIGINAGVMGMRIQGALSASSTLASATLEQEASTDLPVPVLGLEGRWQFGGHVFAGARGAVLPRVTIGDYQGEAYVARAALEYRFARIVGLGVGWNYFNINGAIHKPDYHADLGMTVSGAEVFLHAVFGAR